MKTRKLNLTRSDLLQLIRWGAFIALLVFLLLTVITAKNWLVTLIPALLIAGSFLLKNTVVKNIKGKIALYIIDFILLLGITLLSGETYISTLYSIILIEFYFSNELISNIVMGAISFVSYVVCLFVGIYILQKTAFEWQQFLVSFFNELLIFLLVFMLANLFATVLKKNEQLKEAGARLEEAAILKERNRIAKQIHDTKGHSITTIIVQTELAKLKMETDPEVAKKSVESAHLQAVAALEELRKSVRVLSGEEELSDLGANLAGAINATMAGTDIVVRSDIDDLDLGSERNRFLYSSPKEGLNNGIRHGKATAFYFSLKGEADGAHFLLSDNGSGGRGYHKGYGLSSMEKKARELGGKAEFNGSEEEGFEIRIVLPFPDHKEETT